MIEFAQVEAVTAEFEKLDIINVATLSVVIEMLAKVCALKHPIWFILL